MVGSYWVCHWKKTFWVGGCDGIGGLAYLLFCAAYWSRQPRVFRPLSRSCSQLMKIWLNLTTNYMYLHVRSFLPWPRWQRNQIRYFPNGWKGKSWWRHPMETFSALLAICAGNSPVPAEFPAQRPVTRSFDVFFDLRLNKRLSKQSWGWWFETSSHPLWRHCNVFCHLPRAPFADRDWLDPYLVWNVSYYTWNVLYFN